MILKRCIGLSEDSAVTVADTEVFLYSAWFAFLYQKLFMLRYLNYNLFRK